MVEFSNQLGQIAARMNALIKSSEAAIHHDLLAGALWWSDERPAFDEPEHHWCLRPILRYRTSLILGVPDERYESAWEAAKQLFPAWPGFAEEHANLTISLPRSTERSIDTDFFRSGWWISCTASRRSSRAGFRRALEKRAYRREWADIAAGELHDLLCRYARRTRRSIPENSWDVVRNSIAESTGADRETITKESLLSRLMDIP